MSSPRSVDYEPLLAYADDEHKHVHTSSDAQHDVSEAKALGLRDLLTIPHLFLSLSCALALLLSAMNLSLLAAHDAFTTYASLRAPTRTPSLYPGLERVHWDTPRCRTRTAYSREYARFTGADVTRREHVRAPKDATQFQFGGETSAYLKFRTADYGLENCTLSFNAVLPPPGSLSAPNTAQPRTEFTNSTTSLDIPPDGQLEFYLLPSAGSLAGRTLLATLPIARLAHVGGQATTPPFFCPSGRELHVQAACRGACSIQFGMQGVTTATSSGLSRNQTGFRVDQYEGLTCIDGNR